MTALGKYPRRSNTGIGNEVIVLQDASANVILKKKPKPQSKHKGE